MPVSVEELQSVAPPIAQATPGQSTATLTDAVTPFSSQDAVASYSGTKDAAAASGATSVYSAEKGMIDEGTMTSAAQLNKITSLDSANMRRAGSQGLLAAGARGLDNSSIAAGASQGAMVDRATPLALQDARTYFEQARANQDAENAARQFGAAETNRMEGLNVQLETDVSIANARAANEVSMLNAQLETAVSQGNAEEANRITTRIAELNTEIELNNAASETNTSIANADNQTRTSLENANAENEMNAQVLQANASLNEQFMRGEQAMDLATIQGRYQQLISSNETASRLYDSYFNSISQAMANPDITPDRIAQYVQVQQTMLEAGLRMMDTMNNLDLGEFTLPSAGFVAGVPGTKDQGSVVAIPGQDPTGAGPVDPGTEVVGETGTTTPVTGINDPTPPPLPPSDPTQNYPGTIPPFGTPEYDAYISNIVDNIGPIGSF